MAPSWAPIWHAKVAPMRIPTNETLRTPVERTKAMAWATLPNHASTRSGSSPAPAESPMPS